MRNLKTQTSQLLRRAERYTKTDMVYLASGGFWLSLKSVLIAILSLILSVAFANLLPPQVYGEYKYVFSVFGLLALPTLMGMGAAITRSVARGFEGTPLLALQTKIRWGVFGGLGSLVVALYYFLQNNPILAGAFGVMAFFLPFVDTLGVFNSILTGKKLFHVSTIYEVSIQTIAVTAIIASLSLTNNLIFILLTYFAVYTLGRLVSLKQVVKKYTANQDIDPAAIRYGKHLSLMDVPSIVADSITGILLWQFIGAAPLAVYAFAKGIPSQISVALQRILTLTLPKFAQRDFRSIKQQLTHKMKLVFIFMLLVVVIYIVTAPYIFRIFFPQYLGAVLYSQIFSLTLLFFPQKFIGTAFQAHARTKTLYLTSTVTPTMRVVFALILVPTLGIPGAIIAELSTKTINFLLLSYLLARAPLK